MNFELKRIRQLLLTLVLLAGEAMLSLAWGQLNFDLTCNDEGGGTYRFVAHFDTGISSPDESNYFRTFKQFSFAADSYFLEFEFNSVSAPSRTFSDEIRGEILIVNNQDETRKVAEWTKPYGIPVITHYNLVDQTWGTAEPTTFSNSGRVKSGSTPTTRCCRRA